METELITFSNLEWLIINETEKEKLLVLKDSLSSEQIAKYFLDKKMIGLEYCVKFNDKQSPWWDESYIQRVLNTRFLSDLDINDLNQMKTTLELNGEIRTVENYVRLLTYEEANILPLEIRKTKREYGYWTMKPYEFSVNYGYVFTVCGSTNPGDLSISNVHSLYAVRPVISLKSDTLEKQESNLITEDIEEEFRKALRM